MTGAGAELLCAFWSEGAGVIGHVAGHHLQDHPHGHLHRPGKHTRKLCPTSIAAETSILLVSNIIILCRHILQSSTIPCGSDTV